LAQNKKSPAGVINMAECRITINSADTRFRIEGDYRPDFYDQLKQLVPKTNRAYFDDEKCWTMDTVYFSQIFTLAYDHYSKISLIENGRDPEEFITGKFETSKHCRIRYDDQTAYIDFETKSENFLFWLYRHLPRERWTATGDGGRLGGMFTHQEADYVFGIAQGQGLDPDEKDPEKRDKQLKSWCEKIDLRTHPPAGPSEPISSPNRSGPVPEPAPTQNHPKCRIIYDNGSISLEYEPIDPIFDYWIAKKINSDRLRQTGRGIELGCSVTIGEVDYIKEILVRPWPGQKLGWTIDEKVFTVTQSAPVPLEIPVNKEVDWKSVGQMSLF
jgi:flavodoxin